MWIQLTKNNGEAILVSATRITHISARQAGGSTIYLDSNTTDADGIAKARSLSVTETLETIRGMLAGEGAGQKTQKAKVR